MTNCQKLFRDYQVYVSFKNRGHKVPNSSITNIVINNQIEQSATLCWNGNKFELFEVNGHSNGSICIILNNQYLFSGDNLLKERTLITEFFGSNKDTYKTKTLNFFKSINGSLIVLPGHGESFILREKILGEEL